MKKIEDIINKVHCADCLEFMKKMPENSVNTIITDPPYGLGFMNKEWDKPDRERELIEREKRRSEQRFKEGKSPTTAPFSQSIRPGLGIKKISNEWYQEWSKKWAKECLRVAKPGATMLCFGGTRTYHRLACAIEDAGWQIFDCIFYCYGSGFPKSHNISKALQKKGQQEKAEEWEGFGTALKPAVEPIVCARKPNEGSYAENALRWDVAGLNINGARIGTGAKKWEKPRGGIWKTKPKEKAELIDNTLGRFPSNLILECICDKVKEGKNETINIHDAPKGTFAGGEQNRGSIKNYRERNVGKAIIHTNPECPCYILDRQSGKTGAFAPVKSGQKGFGGVIYGKYKQAGDNGKTFYGDGLSGASRFFYCAKASREERNRGLERFEEKDRKEEWGDKFGAVDRRLKTGSNSVGKFKNIHPTVKPLKLMEYLCFLTKTPKGGIILDPFAGSGTTGMAAKKVGRDYILIEKEEDYCKIAEARIKAVPQPLL